MSGSSENQPDRNERQVVERLLELERGLRVQAEQRIAQLEKERQQERDETALHLQAEQRAGQLNEERQLESDERDLRLRAERRVAQLEKERLLELERELRLYQEIGGREASDAAEVGLDSYRALQKREEAIYAKLTNWEALRTFPSQSIAAMSATGGIYLGSHALAIKRAFAKEHSFTPPLGLPQAVFTDIVLGFAMLFVFVVAGLFYAGYIAKPKNQDAAKAVSHLATFLSGALLGIKAT